VGLITARKKISCILLALVLLAGPFFIYKWGWPADPAQYQSREDVDAFLALAIGILGLLRYYTRRDKSYFFVGLGFLGTACLEILSVNIYPLFIPREWPADALRKLPWSWFAAHCYLGVYFFLSWWTVRREVVSLPRIALDEKKIYLYSLLSVLGFYLVFSCWPLPAGYQEGGGVGRPQEFVPGFFFAIALYGYYRRERWRYDVFEYWVVLSLMVLTACHFLYIPLSTRLLDKWMLAAHSLEWVSFVMVSVGLLISVYLASRDAEDARDMLDAEIARCLQMREDFKTANDDLLTNEKALRLLYKDLQKVNETLKNTQIQLFQSERLKVVGKLASGVAHEVKNPLAIVLQGVEYLCGRFEQGDRNIETVKVDIINAIERADAVIKGLLDFSSISQIELESQRINDILEAALLLVKHQFDNKQIRVYRQFAANIPLVKLDKNKMEQVFVNLLLNAVYATPNGESLTVRSRMQVLTEYDPGVGLRREDHFEAGETVVVVEIEDRGTGIPNDIIARIFDPFFTTKPGKEGTGLGLSVVRNIMDFHKGHVFVQNNKKGGSCATVFLRLDNEKGEGHE
jgi:signal transduction histidine kinase